MKKDDMLKLINNDGFEFVVDMEAAMVSLTFRSMLTTPPGCFTETRRGGVVCPEIRANILEKICQYFYWSLQYASGRVIDEFHIEPDILLEIMMAANYLQT